MKRERSKKQGTGNRKQGTAASSPLPFEFVDIPADFRDDSALVVRVPAGVRSKQKLLKILADKLDFPGYFGWNWDALEECLGDLSWLSEGQPVVIVHEDMPFGAGGEHRDTYQSILASAIARGAGGHPLRVVFPATKLS
jgi:Barstar (barnase inhibitor).